jgi:small GTP-binding protein
LKSVIENCTVVPEGVVDMADLDQLKEVLSVNNISFKEVTINETEIKTLPEHLSQSTLVINDKGELWAVKLCAKTQTNFVLHKLSNFTHIKYIDIKKCYSLNQLPISLQVFTNLQHLDISYNNLTSLPDWLQKLTNLQTLDIRSNNLTSLPDGLQKLTNLQTLYISSNNLTSLPDWLQKLTNLQTLDISYNKLTSLPDWLQKLTNLQTLYIRSNSFQTLPHALLPFLQELDVSMMDVTISDVPDEIVKQGWDAIAQHYAAMGRQTKSSLAELKVIIIGAGNSGKSCISKALQPEYVHNHNEPSTVGIVLRNLTHTFQGKEWDLRMWDFGGQEAYAAAQTLFMTDRTLYLIVADGRTENRPDPYLHYVKTFAPDSPIIILINKIDENERADLNRQYYKERYPKIHEILKFSCVNDLQKHTEDLFAEVDNILAKETRLQVQLADTWLEAKKELILTLNETGKYIEAEKYDLICEKFGVTDEKDKKILRDACHISGDIFSYINKNSNPPVDVIMSPKWVINGINHLFTLKQSGVYPTSDIYTHMQKQGYNKTEINSILAMLQEKDLAEEMQGKFFIPALLPVVNSNFPDRERYGNPVITDEQHVKPMNNREIRFRYPSLHPIVKQIFMIKLFRDNPNINPEIIACRDGVCWEQSGVKVVMVEEADDLAFYLSGGDNTVRNAQIWIKERMDNIHKTKDISNSELWHVIRASVNGSMHEKRYSYEDLRDFLAMGYRMIPMTNVSHKPMVMDVLSGLEPASELYSQEMSVEQQLTQRVIQAEQATREAKQAAIDDKNKLRTEFSDNLQKSVGKSVNILIATLMVGFITVFVSAITFYYMGILPQDINFVLNLIGGGGMIGVCGLIFKARKSLVNYFCKEGLKEANLEKDIK